MPVPPTPALTTGPVCGFIAGDYDLLFVLLVVMVVVVVVASVIATSL